MCKKAVVAYFEISRYIRGPFEKFVDWRQCAAAMQREAVTYAKFSGGVNVIMASSSSL
jgi:hypothetical protein